MIGAAVLQQFQSEQTALAFAGEGVSANSRTKGCSNPVPCKTAAPIARCVPAPQCSRANTRLLSLCACPKSFLPFSNYAGPSTRTNRGVGRTLTLFQSIVQLGEDITNTQGALEAVTQGAVAAVRVSYPTIQAVVRYNITPVDGLFFLADKFMYQLQIRFRGHITAKLMQVDIESGAETQLILFDSTNFPPKPGFQVQTVTLPNDSAPLDFVNKGYYIEATLIKFAVVLGDPSAISVIKLVASPDFSG
jgi:hypothetical protein